MPSKLKGILLVVVLVVATIAGLYISDHFLNVQNKQVRMADEVATEFIQKSCNLRGNYQGTEDEIKNKDSIHSLVRITASDLSSPYLDFAYSTDRYFTGKKVFTDNVLHLSNATGIKLKHSQILPNNDVVLHYKVVIEHTKYSTDYVDGVIQETEKLTFNDITVRVNREGKITETDISGSVGVYNCFGG